jgi:hypothetical protein
MIRRDNNINVRIESERTHKSFDYAKVRSLTASEHIHSFIKTELEA